MQISVSSILQAPHATTRYAFHEALPLPDEGEQLLEPVTGDLTVERLSDRLLRVTGNFQATLQLLCDRCGESYQAPAVFDLAEDLEVVDEAVTTEEVEDRVSASGLLDASDLVRQTLLLSLPARRLCGCEPKATRTEEPAVDPRWAALRSYPADTNGTH
ncbi:MAG: DUF177 domain-containing protein [Candidatus Sericytochromatia bacterium]|nr:DUF177 domain-containing protein [Candidatus Sericytochromatia bacterium]